MELGGVTLLAMGVCKPSSSLNLAPRGRLRHVAVTVTVCSVSSLLLPQEVAAGHRGWAFLVTVHSESPHQDERHSCHPGNATGFRTSLSLP